MQRVARAWWLAWRITKLNFAARLEYRTEFLLMIGVGIAWQVSILVFATVLLTRFPGMGGWTTRDVLLMASMRLLSHGLYVLFFGRIAWLTTLVQMGYLDAFLLRPMPVYRQVQLAYFNTNAIGDLAVATSLFVGAMAMSAVDWTPARIAYLLVALAGGTLMEAAIMTAVSSAAMHTPTTAYWSYWLDEMITALGNYPLHILPALVRNALTFVLPLGFVAYLPTAVLTDQLDTLAVPGWLAVASPLAGPLAYLAARRLWAFSLRHYKGFGGT